MRLSEIDPARIAADEWRRALGSAKSRIRGVAPRTVIDVDDEPGAVRASSFGDAVWTIAQYAVHGILDRQCSIVRAIADVNMQCDASDANSPLGLVVQAARARHAITIKHTPVTVRDLSLLTGVTTHQVRLLARHGELRIVDGEIQSAEARRWLCSRGVAGF